MISVSRALRQGPSRFARLARGQFPLFIGAAALIGIVLAGMVGLDKYLYDLQVQQGSLAARNLSYILSDQTDRSLQSVLSTVSGVVDRLRQTGIPSVGVLKSIAASPEIKTALRDRVAQNPSLDSLYIVGADGTISNPNTDRLLSIVELHGQAHLDALRRASADAVYVSAPFQSTIDGTWQLSLSKRVSANDGYFLGIVSGVVKLASFEALLEKLALGAHGSISIFREDGSIIACFPQREIAFGSEGRLIENKQDGVSWLTSDLDGVERMIAIVHSTKFPVVSVVAVAMGDVVAPWLHQTEGLALAAAAITLLIAFGAIALAIHIERFAAARGRAAVETQVAIQYRRFNNAINNIVQGLAMYDDNNALIACNKRYAEIYGLPAELTEPGATSDKILAYRGDHGFGKAMSEPVTEPDGSTLIVNELPDGRIIAQRKKKLAGGGWVSTHEDITVRRRAEEKIEEMATRDALTGLSNRFEFQQRLEHRLSEVRQRTGKFAVLYVDLDHFKSINDGLGHTAGDALLRMVAARLRATVRPSETVARLGGDEFAVIQRVSQIPGGARRLAESLVAALAEPYEIDGAHVEMAASIGVSLAPEDGVDADELVRKADRALRHSKVARGAYTFFKPSMDEEALLRRRTDRDLRVALAEDQFELHFQPIVSVADRQPRSFEALLRWKHPQRGLVPPSEFIPLAEENGLIVPIGEWVVREACRQAAKWPARIRVAVNVSVVQFKSPKLLQSISEALDAAGLQGSRLIVEVTESVMIKDAEQAISTLHSLRNLGVAIAMDDFGTGYSSLSYLRRFPFDKIKIDKSFVGELGQREESAAIVRAAAGLAKSLGMEAVAEGVETEDQLIRVGIEGCSEAQGYLISEPIPARDVLGFLGLEPRVVRPEEIAPPRTAAIWRERLPIFPTGSRVAG